jgi:hypothetical protein
MVKKLFVAPVSKKSIFFSLVVKGKEEQKNEKGTGN